MKNGNISEKVSKQVAKTNITPKQAQVKLASLLKGIDNSALVMDKHRAQISKNTQEISALVTSLSVPKAEKPAKVAKPKPVKAAKPAKVAKPKPVKAAKPAKVEKEPKQVAKKASDGAAKVKATKPSKDKKPPVDGRPTLKEAMKEFLQASKKPLPAAEIWHCVTEKYGYWSRQSCYNALEKACESKDFVKSEEGFTINSNAHDDTDSFVDSIETDSSEAVAEVQ